jgi:hypothetical protein
VTEDGSQRSTDSIQLGGGQQVIDGKVFHQWVVVVDSGQCLLETSVCIEGHGGVEALSMLQNVKREADFKTFALFLDSEQSPFQI